MIKAPLTKVGDVFLRNDGEIAIVVCRELQKPACRAPPCRGDTEAGPGKGFAMCANIHFLNGQNRRMFLSAGFRKTDEEWYKQTL